MLVRHSGREGRRLPLPKHGARRTKPTAKELLAAYRTMDDLTTWAYRALHEEGLTTTEFVDVWGGWVEAKRQIAIACHWLIQRDHDDYHRAWMAMCR